MHVLYAQRWVLVSENTQPRLVPELYMVPFFHAGRRSGQSLCLTLGADSEYDAGDA